MLHRLIGVDQAVTRRKAARQEPLTPQEEMKLELMCCPVKDFGAIRKALEHLERRAEPEMLGSSWYRRWRKGLKASLDLFRPL